MIKDSDLWESIRDDNEKAFSTLFHRYSSKIYSTAYYYIRDSEVCEQIVHDIFLSLWSKRKTLNIESFTGYLTSAARYRVYKQMTANKTFPIEYKENLEVMSMRSVENSGYDRLASIDLETQFDAYLENLPKRCREIFFMSRKQMLSNDEIAAKLGISKRSVENQITYALKHLRVSIKDISIALILFELL